MLLWTVIYSLAFVNWHLTFMLSYRYSLLNICIPRSEGWILCYMSLRSWHDSEGFVLQLSWFDSSHTYIPHAVGEVAQGEVPLRVLLISRVNISHPCPVVNLLAPELFFLILAHPVYKMRIMQQPNTLELWNKLHFEEKKKRRVCTMFKIFST